jgi:hypothetical protein
MTKMLSGVVSAEAVLADHTINGYNDCSIVSLTPVLPLLFVRV